MKKICCVLVFVCILFLSNVFPQVLAGWVQYIYDDLSRLKTVSYSDGTYIEYDYDEAGNRTVVVTRVETYGFLSVTISPASAIRDGAQWRVPGGPWQDSGTIVSHLEPGLHTVEFKGIPGWTTPSGSNVTISPGKTSSVSDSYVPNSPFSVTIEPPEAISDGAQWRIDGGGWQASGTSVSNLEPGNHTIELKDVPGWDKPDYCIVDCTFIIDPNSPQNFVFIYNAQCSVSVTIEPQEAVDAGAKWRVDTGNWQDSGTTVWHLEAVQHHIEFLEIPGWTVPAQQTVTLTRGGTGYITPKVLSGLYIPQIGSLSVTINPSEAISAGAQWRVDQGFWQNSEATLPSLSVGRHYIEFKEVTGWTEPFLRSVDISQDYSSAVSVAYVLKTGSLSVTVSPPEAVSAGAQWRVDGGGEWQNNGATVSALSPGQHTLEFKDLTDWTKPGTQSVTIAKGQPSNASGSYVHQTDCLITTINPPGAISDGAKWRVDGGTWQNNGEVACGLSVGSHTIEFKTVDGWNTPANQPITIAGDHGATAVGSYVQQTGSLSVTISPAGALSAGAEWQVDGGAWQSSWDAVSGLGVGQHTVQFKAIPGWTTPASRPVTITNGQTTPATGTYIQQIGTISVTITPLEAIDAGAQWKVDNGEWQTIGATTLSLPVGSYTVYFKDIEGWTTPQTYPVSITADQTSTAARAYTIQPVKNITRGTYYPTLQDAYYDAASAGDTLRVLDTQLTENFRADRSISVRIIGGYLPGFTTQANKTVIKGAPVIHSGTVTMGNFRISK